MTYKMLLAKISELELERDRWDLKMAELDLEFQNAAKKKDDTEVKIEKLREELNSIGDK